MTENTDLNDTSNGSKATALIKVKQEKIDVEVECKLKSHCEVAMKAELGQSSDDDSDSSSSAKSEQETEEIDDKKIIAPVKSSNEILAELFGVFNAAPPEELLDDKSLLRKRLGHKKVKKEKKKKYKKGKSDGECSDSNNDSVADGRHKHKKKKKHKRKHKDDNNKTKDIKKERDSEKNKLKPLAQTRLDEKNRQIENHKDRTKNEDRKLSPLWKDNKVSVRERKRVAESSRALAEHEPIAKVSRRDRSADRVKERERTHNSFYNGYRDCVEKLKDSTEFKRERHRPDTTKIKEEKCDVNQRDVGHISDISLSDEETFLRERDTGRRRGGADDKNSSRSHNNFYGTTQTRNCGEERTDRHQMRRHSHSRSRSRTPIDKKRLLEIARKNAINMVKHGKIPDSVSISKEAKEKLLLNWRYGGRTVDDLTEFCRKIANGEESPQLSSDEDSDIDKNGNAKAFHHPFQIKEREPIVMHIRNATRILPARKTDDQTKAITMQFPVSSGQQHRLSEVWVPVDKKNSLMPLPALPPAKQATNIFKDVKKNVFEKPIPVTEQQEKAFKPFVTTMSNANVSIAVEPKCQKPNSPLSNTSPNINSEQIARETMSVIVPTTISPIKPALVSLKDTFVPEVPVPSTNTSTQMSESVFPDKNAPTIDVSSVITKRLNAIRRLQENPTDPEALKMMYHAQRDMSSWATSKHFPGQFTGSTGASVLSAQELNSGPQLWVRRDQLTSTKPVTGGMGMALLQKMGWKPGEGLGPTKTGSLQPLLLDVKLDKRGLVSREDNCQAQQQQQRQQMTARKARGNVPQTAPLNIQDKHPVCVLNELTSKNKWTPPQYNLINDHGPAHSRMFLFSVEINGQLYTPSRASNTKKEAKFMAAKLCLQQLGILPHS